jgi:amino acid permease
MTVHEALPTAIFAIGFAVSLPTIFNGFREAIERLPGLLANMRTQ